MHAQSKNDRLCAYCLKPIGRDNVQADLLRIFGRSHWMYFHAYCLVFRKPSFLVDELIIRVRAWYGRGRGRK